MTDLSKKQKHQKDGLVVGDAVQTKAQVIAQQLGVAHLYDALTGDIEAQKDLLDSMLGKSSSIVGDSNTPQLSAEMKSNWEAKLQKVYEVTNLQIQEMANLNNNEYDFTAIREKMKMVRDKIDFPSYIATVVATGPVTIIEVPFNFASKAVLSPYIVLIFGVNKNFSVSAVSKVVEIEASLENSTTIEYPDMKVEFDSHNNTETQSVRIHAGKANSARKFDPSLFVFNNDSAVPSKLKLKIIGTSASETITIRVPGLNNNAYKTWLSTNGIML